MLSTTWPSAAMRLEARSISRATMMSPPTGRCVSFLSLTLTVKLRSVKVKVKATAKPGSGLG